MIPALEIRDLHYSYPDGAPALGGISFSLAAGERVGLIGPNGAGKSTLLLHLNGLLPDHPGHCPSVRVDGLAVQSPHLPEIRRRVGLLFQDANDQLFCPTVYEDVAFGPQQLGLDDAQVRTRVTQALAQVALSGFEARLTHHLSSGEKRRVCLAGVLACRPSILALDEPTSSLDPRGRRELMAFLRGIALTQLIATHDLELVADLCSRVMVLSQGVIVADGPMNAVLNDEALMAAHGLERPHILRHLHPHSPVGP